MPLYWGQTQIGSVNVITEGGESPPPSPSSGDPAVTFIDYDGTVLYTYTADEFQALSAMPENPSHTGLTAQGWNYTLAQAKTQVADTGGCTIGQMYVTSSGKTEIDVEFTDSSRLSPYLRLAVKGSVVIDWGDNSSTQTVTGTSLTTGKNTSHTYPTIGNYTITINPSGSSDTYGFLSNATYSLLNKSSSTQNQNRVYSSCVKAVRIGNSCSIGSYAFSSCYNIRTITIPKEIESIEANAFLNCYHLRSITLPYQLVDINTNLFDYCYSLLNISFPYGVTNIDRYAFRGCQSLTSINIPSSVTSIDTYIFQNCYNLCDATLSSGMTNISDYMFYNCYSLMNINIPNGITTIGANAFYGCRRLENINLPSEITSIGANAFYNTQFSDITLPTEITSIPSSLFYGNSCLSTIDIPSDVTSIGVSAFYNCYGLYTVNIPDKITNIGNTVFYNCYNICSSITIPSSVTSIGNQAFYNCYSIPKITILSTSITIGTQAFANCYGVKEYHFSATTPPTLPSTNVFTAIPSDCVIYVPYSSDHSILQAYKTATNWSTYASHIQEEPQ